MTTIAYRNGVLAGDTRETDVEGVILPCRTRKVFRLRDGRLFGASDDSERGQILFNSVKSNLPTPKLKDVAALLVHPDGRVQVYEGAIWRDDRAPFHAIGTGKIAALVAMSMKADAIKAVRVAMKFDVHTGGRVQHVTLKRRRR